MDQLGGLLVRRGCECSIHGAHAHGNAADDDRPWTGSHQTVRPAGLVESAGGNADDTETETGMQEGLIEKVPLKGGHAAIFSGFSVKNDVRRNDGPSNNSGSVDELLRQIGPT